MSYVHQGTQWLPNYGNATGEHRDKMTRCPHPISVRLTSPMRPQYCGLCDVSFDEWKRVVDFEAEKAVVQKRYESEVADRNNEYVRRVEAEEKFRSLQLQKNAVDKAFDIVDKERKELKDRVTQLESELAIAREHKQWAENEASRLGKERNRLLGRVAELENPNSNRVRCLEADVARLQEQRDVAERECNRLREVAKLYSDDAKVALSVQSVMDGYLAQKDLSVKVSQMKERVKFLEAAKEAGERVALDVWNALGGDDPSGLRRSLAERVKDRVRLVNVLREDNKDLHDKLAAVKLELSAAKTAIETGDKEIRRLRDANAVLQNKAKCPNCRIGYSRLRRGDGPWEHVTVRGPEGGFVYLGPCLA